MKCCSWNNFSGSAISAHSENLMSQLVSAESPPQSCSPWAGRRGPFRRITSQWPSENLLSMGAELQPCTSQALFSRPKSCLWSVPLRTMSWELNAYGVQWALLWAGRAAVCSLRILRCALRASLLWENLLLLPDLPSCPFACHNHSILPPVLTSKWYLQCLVLPSAWSWTGCSTSAVLLESG